MLCAEEADNYYPIRQILQKGSLLVIFNHNLLT